MGRFIHRQVKEHIAPMKEQGFTQTQIIRALGLGRTTLHHTVRLEKEFNTVIKPLALPTGRHSALPAQDLAFLIKSIRRKPELYLDELRDLLWEEGSVDVHVSTISRALKRAGYSRKDVSRKALERNEELRNAFRFEMGQYSPEQLLFLDESAHHENWSRRNQGWSKVGERTIQHSPFVRGKRFTILPVLSIDGIEDYQIYEGGINGNAFMEFTEKITLPVARSRDARVIVLDKASVHHANFDEIEEMFAEHDIKIHFLPAYSPDLNPIEEAFSSMKAWIRRNSHLFRGTLEESVYGLTLALNSIDGRKAEGWFRHSGYV